MSGKGFMTYATAMTRLRRAPIPMLVNRQAAGPAQSLFAGIFGASPPTADVHDQSNRRDEDQRLSVRHAPHGAPPLCTERHKIKPGMRGV